MKQSEAAKLQTFLRRWREINPYRWQQGAQVVASDLIRDGAFTDIRIAGLLESPAGATVADVVESLLPFPGSAEATVLVEAIEIASKRKTSDQIVGTLACGVLVALLVWGVFGTNGRSSRLR